MFNKFDFSNLCNKPKIQQLHRVQIKDQVLNTILREGGFLNNLSNSSFTLFLSGHGKETTVSSDYD